MADEYWEVEQNAYIYCAPVGASTAVIDDGTDSDNCPFAAWSWCVAGPVWRCCDDGWVAISPVDGLFDRRRFAKNTGELATTVSASGVVLKFQRAVF